MKTRTIVVVAASALLAGVATADAADMAVKAPVAVPAPIFSWTGFYVGGNIGGAWSRNSSDTYNGVVFPGFIVLPPNAAVPTLFPGQLDTLTGPGTKSAVIGGLQAGYNWQVQRVVLGIEADAAGTGFDGATETRSRTFGAPLIIGTPVTQTVTVDYGHINWMASFRGRLGFTADRVLFYATGGAAVADVSGSKATVVNGPGIAIPAGTFTSAGSGSETRWGWTLGGGVEWAFANQWSVAAEYRHSDFGRRSVNIVIPDGFGGTAGAGTTTGRLTTDQVTARVNYRFGGPVVARY
ncbi:outer membrane protein [Bradyrhizobium sp. 23AC]